MSKTAPATTAATPSTPASSRASAGSLSTPSTRAASPKQSTGTAKTATGGNRSKPATTSATTNSNTPADSASPVMRLGTPTRAAVRRLLLPLALVPWAGVIGLVAIVDHHAKQARIDRAQVRQWECFHENRQ